MAESEDLSSNSSNSSSREDMHFFEGVEKLLEIWFKPNPAHKNADLRKIPSKHCIPATTSAPFVNHLVEFSLLSRVRGSPIFKNQLKLRANPCQMRVRCGGENSGIKVGS
uniref:Uncharacterized protein n=1 Tax=Anopheles maculatus TaxID=74869 RepID=A0A182TBP7_9DIPT